MDRWWPVSKNVVMLPIESVIEESVTAAEALDCAEVELKKWNQELDEREATQNGEASDGRGTRADQEDA